MIKNTICLIPVKKKSLGLPNKHLKKLNKKPLIFWTIEVAIASGMPLENIYLSTDCSKIKDMCCQEFGINFLGLRPKELATPTSSIYDVIHYELNKINLDKISYFLLLQATSPLRQTIDIIKSFKEFSFNVKTNNTKTCIGVTKAFHHPQLMYYYENNNILKPSVKKLLEYTNNPNRQNYHDYYAINGALYWATINWIINNKTFFAGEESTILYEMPLSRSIDIDTKLDLDLAKFFINKTKR